MAEAIVSLVLKQLGSVLSEQASGFIRKQGSLVRNVEEEVRKLTNNLQAIQVVLFDAEQKQMKDKAVRVWLHRLKDLCYELEDVLDEWNTEILKLQIERGQDHNALGPQKPKRKKNLPFADQRKRSSRRLLPRLDGRDRRMRGKNNEAARGASRSAR